MMKLITGLAALAAASGQAAAGVRKPPMGWSSWNYRGMRVSAPLLLETADAFAEEGLLDRGCKNATAQSGCMTSRIKRTTQGAPTAAAPPPAARPLPRSRIP